MAGYRNEYEITVEPTGAWAIRHIHGEQSSRVAHGEPKGIKLVGEDRMERGEQEARGWVMSRLQDLENHEEYRKRCRVFTMPATIMRRVRR